MDGAEEDKVGIEDKNAKRLLNRGHYSDDTDDSGEEAVEETEDEEIE